MFVILIFITRWHFIVAPEQIDFSFCRGHCDPFQLPNRIFVPQFANIRYVSWPWLTHISHTIFYKQWTNNSIWRSKKWGEDWCLLQIIMNNLVKVGHLIFNFVKSCKKTSKVTPFNDQMIQQWSKIESEVIEMCTLGIFRWKKKYTNRALETETWMIMSLLLLINNQRHHLFPA